MALLQNFTSNAGVVLSPAYARIEAVSGSKELLTLALSYYVDVSSAEAGKAYVAQEQYTFVPSVENGAENFIKQGYTYLKTIDEFATAIDA